MRSDAREWLRGLACSLVLVSWSDALADNEIVAGIDQANDPKAVGKNVELEGRQPANNRQNNANAQVGKVRRGQIEKSFQGIVAKERVLQLKFTELSLKFRPDHPQCRALRAQLDQLNKQKTELLNLHPFLLRKPVKPKRQPENRIEIEAKLRALQQRERIIHRSLDEVRKEQDLLLRKHPELLHR